MISFKGQFVGVLGAGRSGQAAARLLARLGARVLLSDSSSRSSSAVTIKGVALETGRHSDRLLDAVLLVRSPGIPDHLPILQKARKKKIPIWSELELASRVVRSRRMVAITGTNGKTTTTSLVGALFKAVDPSTCVAGNIGTPLSDRAFRIGAKTPVVIETSSYQLENIERFHPAVSAILNITPDHLEHHRTMQAYTAAKARIFENQTGADTCVLNYDDPRTRALAKRCRCRVMFFSRASRLREGVSYVRGAILIQWRGRRAHFPLQWDLPGPHNVENALAAVAMGIAGGIPVRTLEYVLRRFKGVEHRLEVVRRLRGVRYINDSKATNVDSTRVALESFQEPLVLILGGEGKGAPYAPLKNLIKRQVREMLLIGEDARTLEKELGQAAPFKQVGTMQKAVIQAARDARPGDVVLLSPACASFDQYHNYEERGRHFKALVKALR